MIKPSGLVTLLTDFGLRDPYSGVMTGAILRRQRNLQVVPLCHGIAPQAVREAAFWLEKTYPWFPEGTVHVAVVDPGVGTPRAIVAVYTRGHYFLAPDNGLLPDLLLQTPGAEVHRVQCDALGLRPQGSTFHGRDLFAPLAAMLASASHTLDRMGPRFRAQPCCLPPPARGNDDGLEGQVVTVDHFGNLITNLPMPDARTSPDIDVQIGQHHLPIVPTYSAVPEGQLLALNNAWNCIEIAVRNGSAAQYLKLGTGTSVRLHSARVINLHNSAS